MGKQDCLNVLEKYPDRWMTAEQVSKKCKIGKGNVSKNLHILAKEYLVLIKYLRLETHQNKVAHFKAK